ncbi:FAD-binding protein [Streptomyces sp. HMX87]|uniref:FAD-binding protein n=1 Tax=Streptomyces sp. HMX87 TaxID=3390849 RepID=UPI003A86243D
MTSHHHRGTLDTVVVGSGLAGLARALGPCRAGRSAALLEVTRDGSWRAGSRARPERRAR